jgi:stage V sporulation protein B
MSKHLKKGILSVGILVIVSILSFGLLYLFKIILARNISPAEYGLFYSVIAFMNIIPFFKDLGLYYALAKYIPEFKANNQYKKIKQSIVSVSKILFMVYIPFTIILFFLAPFLAEHYFKNSSAVWVIRLVALTGITGIFEAITLNSYQGFQKFKFMSAMSFTRSLLLVIMLTIGISMGFKGYYVASFAYMIVPLIIFFSYFPYFIKKVFPQYSEYGLKSDNKVLKKLLKFGIPILLALFSKTIFLNVQTFILTFFVSLEQVGLYNVAYPMASVLTFFELAFITVLVPMVSDLWAKKDIHRIESTLNIIYKYIVISLLPLIIIIMSYSKFMVTLLNGSNYSGASTPLIILSIGMLFWTIASINFSVLQGIDRPKEYSKNMFITALINIVGCLILIPTMGIIGASICITISYAILMFMSFGSIKKYLSVRPPYILWSKTIFVGAIFFGVIYYIGHMFQNSIGINLYLGILYTLIISFAVYITLAFILKILKFSEIKHIYDTVTKKD